MTVLDWLNEHAPGFGGLRENERDAFMHFSLLWSLFEAKVLETKGNGQKIVAAVKQWPTDGLTAEGPFSQALACFQNRYYPSGAFTPQFGGLNFRGPDRRAPVERVIKGEIREFSDVAAALLIIVYRLRSNLFHGVKWSNELQGQLENFEHANAVLMKAIELQEQFDNRKLSLRTSESAN